MSESSIKKPQRLEEMYLSPIRQFNEKATAMQQAGRDIVYFTMGEPDFNTPQKIKDAASEAIQADMTHYAPVRGTLELRTEISNMLKEKCGVSYDPQTEIIVTSGGAEALNNSIFSAVGPGDEVIIFAPAFMHYSNMATAAGAAVVSVPVKAEDGYQINIAALEKAITPRTKMLILNNPCNPTGVVYSEKTLEEVCRIACENNLLVLTDEIYNHILYDGLQFRSVASFPGMKERTLLINGFSKTYAMTGWRLGFVAADAELMKNVVVIHQYSTTCAPTFVQYAAAKGMNAPETETDIIKMVEAFERRRNLITSGLDKIEKLTYVKPQGAFYVLVDVSKTGMNGTEFATNLLTEEGVATVPAVAFGKEGTNYIRMSFATSDDRIKEGLKRMQHFVENL